MGKWLGVQIHQKDSTEDSMATVTESTGHSWFMQEHFQIL